MLFRDRVDAGKQLAESLEKYRNASDCVVIGLPRGGVPIGFEIAKALHLPLDVRCMRKIGAPFNPELALGAVSDTGQVVLNEQLLYSLGLSKDALQPMIEQAEEEAQKRAKQLRKSQPALSLKGKTVLIVDDGIATGATMRAAIQAVNQQDPEKIVLAVPVASPRALEEIEEQVDEIICLAAPEFFRAVGQFYERFDQTSTEEAISLLQQAKN